MYLEAKYLLVIDGDTERRRHCERVLAEEGFVVTAVAEGFSAIRAAARRRFALAVIAVDLSGTLDGAATLRQLRARQPWLRALFTGDPKRRPPRLDADRDDFIPVTFQAHELRGCVFELLQREPLFRNGRDLAG
jgi:two-component system phosphate regulon response regulator OmpR